jgi:hypothetical protein
MLLTVKDKVEQALATYNAQDVHSTVYEEYKGFEVYCSIKDKHVYIEAVERLPMTGVYEVSVTFSSYYNVEEGKTCELHRYLYSSHIRSIPHNVTIALEEMIG